MNTRFAFPALLTAAAMAWLLAAGCAGPQIKTAPVIADGEPAHQVEQLASGLKAADQQGVGNFAPETMAQARATYEKSRRSLEKHKDPQATLALATRGAAELANARKIDGQARQSLAGAIDSRQDATAVSAGKLYPKAFKSAEADYTRLVRDFEQQGQKAAGRQLEKVVSAYRDLELRAIQHAALDDIRVQLARDKDRKLYKTAPAAFKDAESHLAAAEQFIAANRYAKADIAARADQARFYVQRLEAIVAACGKLGKMTPEQTALWVEKMLRETGQALKMADIRNAPLADQHQQMLSAIDALQIGREKDRQTIRGQRDRINVLTNHVTALEGNTRKVKMDRERLAAEKRFNERFNKVQGFFGDNEAEVYKQGGQLIIRLKAMHFPVGQAIIMPDNYQLLSKVQKAIRTFGQPRVRIEGHSDSTGSDEVNNRLSAARAEAVRQYLAANRTLPIANLSAAGFGASRPIASNATAAGRAINRRIDVVIFPSKTDMK